MHLNIQYKFGNGTKKIKVSEKKLKEEYGCTLKNIKEGSSWDAYLIVNAKIIDEHKLTDGNKPIIEISIDKIYSEKNKQEWILQGIDASSVEQDWGIDIATDKAEKRQKINEKLNGFQKLKKFATEFAEDPIGAGCNALVGIFIIGPGDVAQIIANALTLSDVEFLYDYSQLKSNKELYEYTKVNDKAQEDETYEYEVTIKKYESDEKIDEDAPFKEIEEVEKKLKEKNNRPYTEDTEIPFIMADLYNMAANNIDFLNINIFEFDEDKEETPWMYLQQFVVIVIHATLYMGTAFLLVTLIYNGVQIARVSLNNPTERKKYIEGIKKIMTSLLLLVGTVVIMALTIYGVEMIFKDLKVGDSKQLPIRVHVEDANYSFSTTITGYIRYMAQVSGTKHIGQKIVYGLAFLVLAVVNLAMTILMIVRMLVLLGLSMIGAIIAALYAINIEWPMKYKTWKSFYIKFAMIQAIIAVVYRIFLLAFK